MHPRKPVVVDWGIGHGEAVMRRAGEKNLQRAFVLAGVTWATGLAMTLALAGCRAGHEAALVWEGAGGPRSMGASAVPHGLVPTGTVGIRSAPWGESSDATFQLLELSVAEKPHVHDGHDLTIVMLRGRGILYVAERRYSIEAGDIVQVGRGIAHHFHPEGAQPVVGLGIFVPRLEAADTRLLAE